MADVFSSSSEEDSDRYHNPDDDYVLQQPSRRSARIAKRLRLDSSSTDEDPPDENVNDSETPTIAVTSTRKNKRSDGSKDKNKKTATSKQRRSTKPQLSTVTNKDPPLEPCTMAATSKYRAHKKKKSQATTEIDHDAATSKPHRMLNKTEKSAITKLIADLPLHVLETEVQTVLVEHAQIKTKQMYDILAALLKNATLWKLLIDHHRVTFIDFYDKCSKGKEKYLHFQIQWCTYCSAFLLPKQYDVECECVLSSQQSLSTICMIRQSWLSFIEPYKVDDCNKLMIMISSTIYDNLLKRVHTQSASTTKVPMPCLSNIDGDDVYFRFGGAVISDMLHLRYNSLKVCQDASRKKSLSQQIMIMQAINTKEKIDMPSYLQYRDRGYMYSPHKKFIPFFRLVDSCVKEVVNDAGFKEHGEELIKVCKPS